ncbi:MAG: hypothetical protein DI552_00265 [Brevundimonas sp.]|uniref:hypothetical protein n=1 Tax=Brevundimonas sp. TaxID=1871086 RepID=UPI000DBC2530|nr:hypothetical protein [Brevundimonas sp.]PZU62338.1 MAG: hypothetical protein DI552_00265 [Brevundimonas sp.]
MSVGSRIAVDPRVAVIADMIKLVDRVAGLNENAGEIGEGMLRQLVADARRIQGVVREGAL